jgi:hypothetical protein
MENPNNTKPEEQKQQNEKLLRLMTGYDQHASPILPHTAPILNVLIQMKNDNKSDYTIKFTNKALTFLSKHTSLNEPEAVKALIAKLPSMLARPFAVNPIR